MPLEDRNQVNIHTLQKKIKILLALYISQSVLTFVLPYVPVTVGLVEQICFPKD